MKVTFGPIVTEVSGRFAGMVFSRWQGVSTIRRFTPPSNPNTADQQAIRNLFFNANRTYQQLAGDIREWWSDWATGIPGIGRNGLIQSFGRNLYEPATFAGAATLGPSSVNFCRSAIPAVAGAANQITFATVTPEAPFEGFTLDGAVGVAWTQGATAADLADLKIRQSAATLRIFETAVTAPDTRVIPAVVVTGLNATGFVRCAYWLVGRRTSTGRTVVLNLVNSNQQIA